MKPKTPYRIIRAFEGHWEAWCTDGNPWIRGWGKTPFAALEKLKKNLKVEA